MSHKLHTVLGASGGIGSALVAELAAEGRRVRAVARRPIAHLSADVEQVQVDISTADGTETAIAGSTVVYHAAQPELAHWLDQFPAMTRNVAAAAAQAHAKLVFADNLYCYGPVDGPLTEATSQRPAGPKSLMRSRMADELLAQHAVDELRVTIGRASDYYGPGGVGSALGESVFKAALAGKAVRWLGPLDVPHTMSYLPDVARALIVLGDSDAADGQAWHLPAGEALTAKQFTELIEKALGQPVKLAATGCVGFWVASRFVPVLRELKETRHQWQTPFVSDASHFQRTFGPFASTPDTQAVRETVLWWKADAVQQTTQSRANAGVTPK